MVWKKFASYEEGGALSELSSSPQGLSLEEAKKRFQENRGNGIKPHSSAFLQAVRERLKSSFLYLLLAASGLSFFLGDHIEGSLILIFIGINLSLETYQEYHSAKAIRLLKRYLVVHAQVRRNGKIFRVESTEVVLGDIVLIEAGDRLPADIRFLRVNGLELDESLLTGESVPIEKIS